MLIHIPIYGSYVAVYAEHLLLHGLLLLHDFKVPVAPEPDVESLQAVNTASSGLLLTNMLKRGLNHIFCDMSLCPPVYIQFCYFYIIHDNMSR